MRYFIQYFLLVLIALGATIARSDESQRINEEPITEYDRGHWAFQKLSRPPLPGVARAESITPIDRFIRSRLEEDGLKSLPPADRITLIRRLSFDLTGLPPSPDQIHAFANDRSADAYDRLVDSLLASPHHGERFAQHWLDLARFAETDGFEHDKVRAGAWRYRDWVIGSLNSDLPYDQFLQLQIAGDELRPHDEQAAVATSFCLSGPDMPDINSMQERQHNVLNELTGTISATLLGLQMGCAECHDHKFDPISQADFYRLRAIFQPAIKLKKNKSLSVLDESGPSHEASYLMVRGNWQRQGPRVDPGFPRIANSADEMFSTAGSNDKTSGRRSALARWITREDHLLTTRVLANRLWQYHFGNGLSRTPNDFGVMGDEPSHPDLLDWLATEVVREQWSLKRMHRLLVTSATYRQASRASVPEWVEGMRLSAAERLKKSQAIDPENRLLARFPRQRLDGEVIRDAMLAATGLLNTRQGGPGIRPPLPPEMKSTLLRGQWVETRQPAQHHRRSIYLFARRNLRYPIFEVFDRPDANASCPQRSQSTTAPQSLLMLNSEFSLKIAKRLSAMSIASGEKNVSARIRFCFLHALGRPPTAGEIAASSEFVKRQSEMLGDQGDSKRSQVLFEESSPSDVDQALVDLCLALLNCNEFVYLD